MKNIDYKDRLKGFVGEFTLTEIKHGESKILFKDKNLIVNRAKQSMAQAITINPLAEHGGSYTVGGISRFMLGTGAHTGLSVTETASVDQNELFAKTKRDGGDSSQDAYIIDFIPNGESVSTIEEYDSAIIWGGSGVNHTNKLSLTTPSSVTISYDTNSDSSGTFIEGITYTYTIPEGNANQDGSPLNPIYYSEAGLFIRKGQLDASTGDAAASTDMFATKLFPPKPKDNESSWVISWKILF